MKKVGLYLGAEPGVGGTFQYSQNMLDAVAALPKNEFETIVAYSSTRWQRYLKDYQICARYFRRDFLGRAIAGSLQKGGLPIAVWRALGSVVHAFSRKFIRENCHIWIFPAQENLSYRIRVPAVAAIHDLMHRYEPSFAEVSAGGEYQRREQHYRNVCRWTKAVVVDSEMGKLQVCESYGLPEDRIKILPFTAPKYIYSERPPSEFSKKYALPEKYVFYPAQFWEHKNHKALIRSAKKILSRASDLKLVFVGSKKNGYESTIQLIAELDLKDRVQILGYVPDEDMPELYRRARCMIMPTFFGPTNIPPLEAFATGCPVAVSNIYGMRDQVGHAALLFDPKSDDEISEVMSRLWFDDELCKRLSARGFEQLKQRNQEQFNTRLASILRELT